MNWRATHILTGRRDLAILPNSSITTAKLVNASFPGGVHGIAIAVEIESSTPPSAGVEMLQRATLNCRYMVTTPAPIVAVTAIRRTCTEYEVTLFVADLADSTRALNELFDLAPPCGPHVLDEEGAQPVVAKAHDHSAAPFVSMYHSSVQNANAKGSRHRCFAEWPATRARRAAPSRP